MTRIHICNSEGDAKFLLMAETERLGAGNFEHQLVREPDILLYDHTQNPHFPSALHVNRVILVVHVPT